MKATCKWTNPNVIMSEVTQTQKDKYCVFFLILSCNLWIFDHMCLNGEPTEIRNVKTDHRGSFKERGKKRKTWAGRDKCSGG